MLKGVPAPLKMTKNVNIECKHDSQTSTYDNDSLAAELMFCSSFVTLSRFENFKLKLRRESLIPRHVTEALPFGETIDFPIL